MVFPDFFQGTKDMKKERAIMTERKRQEQQKDAREFMSQHWKLNDPGKHDGEYCSIDFQKCQIEGAKQKIPHRSLI